MPSMRVARVCPLQCHAETRKKSQLSCIVTVCSNAVEIKNNHSGRRTPMRIRPLPQQCQRQRKWRVLAAFGNNESLFPADPSTACPRSVTSSTTASPTWRGRNVFVAHSLGGHLFNDEEFLRGADHSRCESTCEHLGSETNVVHGDGVLCMVVRRCVMCKKLLFCHLFCCGCTCHQKRPRNENFNDGFWSQSPYDNSQEKEIFDSQNTWKKAINKKGRGACGGPSAIYENQTAHLQTGAPSLLPEREESAQDETARNCAEDVLRSLVMQSHNRCVQPCLSLGYNFGWPQQGWLTERGDGTSPICAGCSNNQTRFASLTHVLPRPHVFAVFFWFGSLTLMFTFHVKLLWSSLSPLLLHLLHSVRQHGLARAGFHNCPCLLQWGGLSLLPLLPLVGVLIALTPLEVVVVVVLVPFWWWWRLLLRLWWR